MNVVILMILPVYLNFTFLEFIITNIINTYVYILFSICKFAFIFIKESLLNNKLLPPQNLDFPWQLRSLSSLICVSTYAVNVYMRVGPLRQSFPLKIIIRFCLFVFSNRTILLPVVSEWLFPHEASPYWSISMMPRLVLLIQRDFQDNI